MKQLSFCLVPNKFLRNVNGSTCEERERKKRRIGGRKIIYFGFLIEYSDIKKADNLCYRIEYIADRKLV